MRFRVIFFNVLYLILGGIVGAGTALLLAPQSGRATRSMIRTSGELLKDRVAEDVNLTRWQLGKRFDSMAFGARHRASHIGSQLKDRVESIQMPHMSNDR